MTKHKSILTDAEMHTLISGNPFTLGLSIARLKDFIRQVEKAVVAKLAEQEPVAWRVHPFDYGVGVEGAYAITQQESQKRAWVNKGWSVTPLYERPMPIRVQGFLDSSNHIADMRKKVGDAGEALRKDAERYHWLRDGGNDDIGVVTGFDCVDVGSAGVAGTYRECLEGEQLDKAIDAAMEKQE